MNAPFTRAEVDYLIAWAREDHQGLANGRARTLQRQHGISAAVLGQLFARLSTVTGRSQFEMVEGTNSEGPFPWPWPSQAAFDGRLKELLPASTIRYLEELGALATAQASSWTG
jgi:hypothetical protein